jgi:hypothetical protein
MRFLIWKTGTRGGKTIYTMLDAFIGKKKLKDALSNVLHDVK